MIGEKLSKPTNDPKPIEQPVDFRGRRVWTPDVFPPPSLVDYTRVFAGVPNRAALVVTGLATVLMGFVFVIPLAMQLVLAITYLFRGRPGNYTEYVAQAIRFEFAEGMFASHFAIALLIVVALLGTRFINSRDPKWLVSVQPGMRWRFLFLSLAASLVILAVFFFISNGFTFPEWNPEPNFAVWMILILLTTPLQAAGEEFLFRGYLMTNIGSFLPNKWATVAVGALVFTLLHGIEQSPSLLINRFGFGLIAGALVVLTGGLESAMAAHVANNVLAFSFAASSGTLVSARTMTDVSWATTGWNLLSYAVTGLVIIGIGRMLKVATRTPFNAATQLKTP